MNAFTVMLAVARKTMKKHMDQMIMIQNRGGKGKSQHGLALNRGSKIRTHFFVSLKLFLYHAKSSNVIEHPQVNMKTR